MDSVLNSFMELSLDPSEPFRFADLPKELRDKIYGYLLLAQHCEVREFMNPFLDTAITVWRTKFAFCFEILQVSKSIHEEASAIFRENAFVCITTTSKIINETCYDAGLPIFQRPSDVLAAEIQENLVSVAIALDDSGSGSGAEMPTAPEDVREYFVFPAVYLDMFCRIIMREEYIHALDGYISNAVIRVRVINVKCDVLRVLSPLQSIRNIRESHLIMDNSFQAIDTIISDMKLRGPNACSMLENAMNAATEANGLCENGETEEGLAKYIEAQRILETGHSDHSWTVLGSGRYKNMKMEEAVINVNLGNAYGIAQAHRTLDHHDQAIAAANYISLERHHLDVEEPGAYDIPEDTAAGLFYEMAHGYLEFAMFPQTRGCLERAREYDTVRNLKLIPKKLLQWMEAVVEMTSLCNKKALDVLEAVRNHILHARAAMTDDGFFNALPMNMVMKRDMPQVWATYTEWNDAFYDGLPETLADLDAAAAVAIWKGIDIPAGLSESGNDDCTDGDHSIPDQNF